MFIQVICAWCGRFMGTKETDQGLLPISHSICCTCKSKVEEETKTLLPETATTHTQERRHS